MDEQQDILKGKELNRGIDVENKHLTYTLKDSNGILKRLVYDYERCNGCGTCVNVCPTQALELGPIQEIATGLDAPPITWNIEKCTFCGMCVAFCPLRAVKIESETSELSEFPSLESCNCVNEKCLPCIICEATCPHDAIEVEIDIPKKEELLTFDEGAEGTIEIDVEKCTLCGVCARFCEAFLMVEKEVDVNSLMPFEDVLIDESKCDYCTLCVELCPEEAIKVEKKKGAKVEVETPILKGHLKVDDDLCTRCGWCSAVCPYDAIEVERPFESEVKLLTGPLLKCDPIGCHACFNVCPSNCFYVKEGGVIRIGVNDEFCIGCGACVNACPLRGIEVYRKESRVKTYQMDAPWRRQWEDAISSLLSNSRKRFNLEKTMPKIDLKAKFELVEEVQPPEKDLNGIKEIMSKLERVIRTPKERKKIELEWNE